MIRDQQGSQYGWSRICAGGWEDRGGVAVGKMNDVIRHFNKMTLTAVMGTDEKGKGRSQETD